MTEIRERTVLSGTSALAVYERGEAGPGRPTIVLAHGWPDSAAMWGPLADRLAASGNHVVTFDARGIGRSTPALVHRPYAIDRMADDIDAVARAVSPDRPAHLVGHDWGSVQMWEYVADPQRRPWAASFTSISGPCLDHLGHGIRRRLRRPTPPNLAAVLAQALKSSYIAYLHVPGPSTLMWRLGFARPFRTWLRRVEGVPADAEHPAPTLPQDAIRGVGLYRTNIVRRLVRPQERRTAPDLPVQLVVATRDHYLTPRLFDDVPDWVPNLTRVDLDAGHWCTRTHADGVADLIATFVASHTPVAA